MVRKIGTDSTVLIKLYHSTVTEIDDGKFAAHDLFFLQPSNFGFITVMIT